MGCVQSAIDDILAPFNPPRDAPPPAENKQPPPPPSPPPVPHNNPVATTTSTTHTTDQHHIHTAPDHTPPSQKHDEQAHSSFKAPTSPGHLDSFGHKVDEHGARIWSDDYYKARADADKHAKERGHYFEQSKFAYDNDQKHDAKTLSEQGKEQGRLMEEANQRAVNEILLPQHLSTSDKIDLHGLLLHEAIDATKEFILSKKGKYKTVEVITGQGLHSDHSKGPVIKPAIIDMCKKEGWQLDINDHNSGSFIVHVPQ